MRRILTIATLACVLFANGLLTSALAATRTWDGGGANDNWNTVNNWDNNALPENTADVVFGTGFGSGTSIDLVSARIVNSLTISTLTAFSITGGDNLTLTSGALTRNDVSGTEGNHSITAAIILGANGVFNINGSGTLTIDGVISDGASTYGLTKNENGVLILSGGANTYNGDTTINGGVLRLGADNKIGNGSGFGNLTVNSGGTFDLAGFSDTINGLSGAGTVDKSTTGTETLTIGDNNASATFSGVITDSSGTINLVKIGTGTQILSGANSYSGTTAINAGVLRIANSLALGTTSSGVTVASGAALELTGNITVGAEVITSLGGNGISSGGALRNISGDNIWAGDITLADGAIGAVISINSDSGTLTISGDIIEITGGGNPSNLKNLTFGGAGNVSVSGNITEAGTSLPDLELTKTGAGTLTLSGSNNFTGTNTVNAGVLRLDSANALSGGIGSSGGTSALRINGGVLGLGVGDFSRALGTGASQVQFTGSGGFAAYGGARNVNLGGASAAVTWASGSFVPNGSTLILGAGDADNTVTFQNPISFANAARTVQVDNGSAAVDAVLSGVLSSSGSSGGFTKTGTGTLQLTGANTYDGVTTVNAGILSVSSLANGGATSGIGDSSSAAANLVLNGGTLQYTGGSASSDRQFTLGTSGGTIDTSGSGAFNFSATAAVTMSGTGTRTLTLTGNNTGNNILAAVVGNQSGNATTLVKDGAGKWILTGNNTYTGQTYINAGTLQVGNGGTSGALGGTAAVNNNGALVVNRSDAITINNAITGNGSLTQAGTGTTTLGVANNYSGGTTLSGGTLKLGVDNAVGSGGMVFAGGTLDSNGRSFSIGALSMTADSTLDLLSTGSGSLTFASATASLGTTLTINNWVGTAEAEGGQQDRIFITANPGATFLSQVSFFGYDPGAVWMSETHELLPNGLTPVPEPTEWALIIFAVLAVFYKFVLPRLRAKPALVPVPVVAVRSNGRS